MKDCIIVKGAREHNLKNINVTIPRNKLVVFTGLSGSGKSSLAFDTIYAEGQRKYMESLSSYARLFLGQLDKPDVDEIEGLSPSISIDQKTTTHNPRSTVGTVTEIHDYLRLLFAKIGHAHCPNCHKEITHQSIDQIVDVILKKGKDKRVVILAPIARGKKGEFQDALESLKRDGYLRVEIDSKRYILDTDEVKLDKNIKHNIYVIIDRIIATDDKQARITQAVDSALKLADSVIEVEYDGGIRDTYSTKYACIDCNINIEEITPRLFSFNSPFGACPTCHGLGYKSEIDLSKLIRDWSKSLDEGVLDISGWNLDAGKISYDMFKALSVRYGFSMKTPLRDLPKKIIDILLYGSDDEIEIKRQTRSYTGTIYKRFEGVVNNIVRRYKETQSESMKLDLERFMKSIECDTCHGKRLKEEALSVRVGGLNIAQCSDLPICDLYKFIDDLKLSNTEQIIAKQIIKEIKARLQFLINVGLDYLSLSRSASTLSGGESQRIRLATQIGSGLMGVLYILDEPSIGLHQKDNDRLLSSLENLRDLGNTLIVVEHDEDTIKRADYIVDIGPKAGINGGYLVAQGNMQDIIDCKESITGKYLSKEMVIDIPNSRRNGNGKFIIIRGANKNNLKNIDCDIPLGKFNVVTGVSGSGKSSLINEVLFKSANNILAKAYDPLENCTSLEGIENIDKIIDIDQTPIGRTPRSNPATYTGLFTHIRDLFAETKEAKARGYQKGQFSFNVKGGRCENCSGDGIIKIEMHFLSDVYVPCEVCKGKRYTRETLQVKYKGKSIYDVLEMTVEEALIFFANIPQINRKLKTLYDVGLSYIKLGQPATTLSGGEAQRLKLATELSKRSTGQTLYILDEPTTGLHSDDVNKLINVLDRLVDAGNTVVVIEHNMDVIKVADNIIDLGPNGGNGGGEIIAKGTPEEIMKVKDSYTGQYLKKHIEA